MNTASAIVVEDRLSQPASTDFNARFAALANAVRMSPYRTGLMPTSLLQKLVELPWPSPCNFFIASSEGQVIATIGANCSLTDPGQGFIGFYECDLSHPLAAQAGPQLIAAAESFLRQQGVRRILAPANYSTWFQYRFLKPGTAGPFYKWEPVQPPEYFAHFAAAGYQQGTEYLSIGHDDATPFIEAYTPTLDRALARGYSLRPFDAEHLLDKEVPILHRISMAGFAGTHLFEPITLDAFRNLYVPLANKMDLSYCRFALDPDGKEVGYLFAFFDETEPRHFVIKTMTLLPQARGTGLSNALVCNAFRMGRDNGSTRTIHAMMRSDAQSRSYGKHVRIDWEHQYILLEKTL